MDAGDWIALSTGAVSVGAASIAIWQARTASASASSSAKQARAADEQVRVAIEQLGQAERLHREQLALAQRIHKEQNEPYVIVDIRPDAPGSFLAELVIENIGTTLARDVRFSVTPELDSSQGEDITGVLRSLTARTIPTLAPGQRLRYLFDVSHQRFESGLPMEFEFTVDASGPEGPVSTLCYTVDLTVLRESLIGERPNKRLEEALKAIEGHLKGLNSLFKDANHTKIADTHRAQRDAVQRQRDQRQNDPVE
ncbi:hypothetical protein [Streptomyces sp. NPDC054854]